MDIKSSLLASYILTARDELPTIMHRSHYEIQVDVTLFPIIRARAEVHPYTAFHSCNFREIKRLLTLSCAPRSKTYSLRIYGNFC